MDNFLVGFIAGFIVAFMIIALLAYLFFRGLGNSPRF